MSVVIRGKNPRKPHTVRYWADGRQREKSFATASEARDFKIKTDHDVRARLFVDDRAGRELFGAAAEAWLARLAIVERTRGTYREVYRRHIAPALAHRTLAQVAADRDAVARLLTSGEPGSLGTLSISPRRAARMIITGTLDEAVRAGKLPRHRCADIELPGRSAPTNGHDAFVFPSHGQVAQVADAAGIAVWLMRGCGLRISEALAVERADFRDGEALLRVSGQASRDGRARLPLKHRRVGEYRDVPVPGWLAAIVADLPDGPLCPGRASRYVPYRTALNRFSQAAARAGIPAGFTPHSLRHAYASALLARGVPISDLAVWLGHRNINVTYAIYGHLVPDASARAVAALDAEYAEWAGLSLAQLTRRAN
jgi:integrase